MPDVPFLLQVRGFRDLAQAADRHPDVGQHDDVVGNGDDGPQDDADVLDDGENVPGGEAAAPFHADASQEDHQQGRHIQHEGRSGVDDLHAHVGPDDVVGHGAGGTGDPFVGLLFPVEGPDDPDAPQPFPDQVVLLVAVFVGDLPEMLDLPAHQHPRADQQRHGAEDHQGEGHVLPHAEEHAPQEHQGDDEDAAAEHGDDFHQGVHVVGGAGHQVGGADPSHLRQGHGVHLAEEGASQAPGIAGDGLVDHPVAPGHGGQAHQGDPQHPGGGFQYVDKGVGLRGTVNALVQHVGHEGGQQQIADSRNGHQKGGQSDLAPVGLEIG